MAEKRMISKKIVDTDAFTGMPVTSRLLYYELNWHADDDGFVAAPRGIVRMTGCTEADLVLLNLHQFILDFDSGIILIRDWRLHNYIQKDRYKPTIYIIEKSQITLNENGAYTKCIQGVSNLDTQESLEDDNKLSPISIQDVSNLETQNRSDKNRSDKNRLDKNSTGMDSQTTSNRINDFSDEETNVLTKVDEILKPLPDLISCKLREFIEYRRLTDNGMTDNAVKILVRKLKELSDSEEIQIKIIEQSILCNWKNIFELKDWDKQKQHIRKVERTPEGWNSLFDAKGNLI